MAFSGSGAGQGAISGAIAAAPTANPYAILGSAAIGAVEGGFFGGQSKIPHPDINALTAAINAGAAEQSGIATALPGQLQPLNTKLSSDLASAIKSYKAGGASNAQRFLAGLGSTTDLQGRELKDVLAKEQYGAVPAETQAIRENLTATGGTQRGGAAAALNAPQIAAAGRVGEGQTALDVQAQQAKASGLATVAKMTDEQLTNVLGINRDEAMALYNSGRQDLINQANQLIQINQVQTADLLSAQTFGASAGLASDAAAVAQRNQFSTALMQAGTTLGAAGINKGLGTTTPKVYGQNGYWGPDVAPPGPTPVNV